MQNFKRIIDSDVATIIHIILQITLSAKTFFFPIQHMFRNNGALFRKGINSVRN